MSFVGLEITDLIAAEPMSPNWKRKGPSIEVELFEQAEMYLQTELVPDSEVALINGYRAALGAEDFDEALECLVQLGERQECSNPFWRLLERIAEAVWPTQWMVDRRAKGQREARIACILRRARGYR